MNLTEKGKIYLAICALSFIFSFLLITPNYFPHSGLSTSLIAFTLFSYKLKSKKNFQTKKHFILALIFSTFIFIRSEPLITFFNLSATLFFGLLMLTPFEKISLAFLEYIYVPITYLLRSVFGQSNYFLELKSKNNKGSGKLVQYLIGIFISIFLLAIILPILSTVNPFFKNLVNSLWNFLNIENLLSSIGYKTVFLWLMRLIFTLGFIFFLPKLLTFTNKKLNLNIPIELKKELIRLQTPKLVVAITLCVFLVTQLQFYLASDIALARIGISHSEHVNEVFGQLSFVAIILILLIYNSRHSDKLNITLNWTLGVQGLFLSLMAYKSDFEYINAWGLTYKRLYGLAVASWILGIFILLFNNHIKKMKSVLFVKNSIIFTAVILILINIANFDYLIYHFDKSTTGQGIDYAYLSRLSSDSLSYSEQFTKLEEATNKELSPPEYDNENTLILLYKIEKLQEKYKILDIRTMNFLEYMQYLQIRSIDTQTLRSFYTNKILHRAPQPIP